MPSGLTRPTPVMTTRFILPALPTSLLSVLLDVVDGVLDGPDLLGVLVRDVDLEGLFERRAEPSGPERVRAEIFDDRRPRLDVLLPAVELLLDDALDLARDVLSHICSRLFGFVEKNRCCGAAFYTAWSEY